MGTEKLERWPSRVSQPESGENRPPGEPPCEADDLTCIPGVTSQIADRLEAAGLHTFGELRSARDDELLAVPGIGPGKLVRIRAYLGL